ncbi:HNH endonuclease signature motif containing protein [Rhodococcus zopfii]|uniref:HNH endonuclease signature motif containing protein n=1 Tax=Rhodococcus zopfii TaxID=43772 RepID=UPI0036674ADE
MSITSLPGRFARRISVSETGCWEWFGPIGNSGYGQCKVGRLNKLTHRVVYEILVGPIPDGLQIDHLCKNRTCCNPAHLEPVTARENVLRGDTIAAANIQKSNCPKGHEYDYTSPSGRRGCRTCRRAAVSRYAAKKRHGTV